MCYRDMKPIAGGDAVAAAAAIVEFDIRFPDWVALPKEFNTRDRTGRDLIVEVHKWASDKVTLHVYQGEDQIAWANAGVPHEMAKA